MTDKELIQALRHCYDAGGCAECPYKGECLTVSPLKAADRLEALLADNAALGREIDRQICKRSELEREIGRLEVERDHFRDLTKKLWCEKRYCKETDANASKVESFRCTGEKCPLELGNIRRCTMRNCPWRTTPSTEVSPTGQKG